ncbi:retinol dehydrogenase 14-like isoform X1 [Leptotrombidium deliense]|uniref:Retinol dehydrogenase 14-like isoform X1 n=1 Tax=Leptotrombidium deliense TaxID=299467 RepID=A0A443SNC6_9ACAR|nr:retinol dehydrogenase 14-like isoform X1 [Leptotrombidium deliense]
MDVIVSCICAFVVVSLILLKIYTKISMGWCNDEVDMSGKTVIITGGNAGIGKETARGLAKKNAKVILACRNMAKARVAAEDIIKTTGNNSVFVKHCDLAALATVRSFCNEILNTENRLDVLILNAGMVPSRGKHMTQDSLELQFSSNHLGHFLMTNLLLQLLKKSAPSRIVVVSSYLHHYGNVDFENLSFEKYTPDPLFTYCKSKLANILFVKELTRRLQNTQVTANALHPGLVKTDINKDCPWYTRRVLQPIAFRFAKTAEEGAQTSIFLSTSNKVQNVSGKYFVDCKEANYSPKADDVELCKKMWSVSKTMTSFKCSV